MQRWKLTVEYDGTNFVGWQRQAVEPSVQSVLEDAIEKFEHTLVRLHVAGRTDAGVHARGQVAHVDLTKNYAPHELRNAINYHVRPHAVSVIEVQPVSDEFHARFGALKRYYRYIICNRRAPLAIGPFLAWHVHHQLDIEKMQSAADALLGMHDFTSFRAVACQAKSPIRSIDSIKITRDGEMIYADFAATSFLHHQVRNIMGTLKKIGEGSWPVACMAEILQAKDRSAAGPTAPPHGLYFMRVDYTESGSK